MRTWRQLFNTVYRYVLKGICSDEETYYQFTLASIKCTFQKLVSKILQDHLSHTFDYIVEVSPPWLVNTWVYHCAMDVQKPHGLWVLHHVLGLGKKYMPQSKTKIQILYVQIN